MFIPAEPEDVVVVTWTEYVDVTCDLTETTESQTDREASVACCTNTCMTGEG